MKVLVVSESAEQHRFVAGSLGPAYAFTNVTDGRTAIARAEAEGFDLVVTDETAEPFGAFGLARELKNLIDPPGVIVLLERPGDAWLARWSGADRWLVPPVDSFELADTATALTHPGAPASRRNP